MTFLNMGVRMNGIRLSVFALCKELFYKYRQIQTDPSVLECCPIAMRYACDPLGEILKFRIPEDTFN